MARDSRPELDRLILEAREAERSRLAREIHDGPAQALSNAVFRTDLVARALDWDPETARAELAELRALLLRQLDNLRGFVHQLAPPLGEGDALDAALEEAGRGLRDAGTEVDLRLEAPNDALDAEAQAVVLRVAQEALRNIAKHAHAHHVRIETSLGPDVDSADRNPAWTLLVEDDGVGFDVDDIDDSRHHFGLRFMDDRARLVGGRLDIEPRVGSGVSVRLTIPADTLRR
jgi:two-component system sensor histidine kinase DegS